VRDKQFLSWNVIGLNDQQVVDLIRKDNIDILVDLAGHTAGNRINVFAYKPAPIQITWLGYPNTTGLKSIDYRFTDAIADPLGKSEQFHSEQLIRLPHGFLCYQGNESVPLQKDLPYIKNNYITFGSFNNMSKINDQVIKLWSRVLQAVSDSHLILKSKQFADTALTTRFLNLFEKEGILNDRISIYAKIPNNEQHLSLYNSIDIALDPFPYNGTTTTCEALWMGVPTITLKGNKHSNRVGASIMTHVGLEEFIAENEQDYINTAKNLSNHTENLAKIRSGLRQQMKNSPLCDDKLFARSIEKVYIDLWEKYTIS